MDTHFIDLDINITTQELKLFIGAELLCAYRISTALLGPGEQAGSYQTPRGLHKIRAKIGAGMPHNTVFVSRRPTGEMYTPELGKAHPGRDWMLTRILWLSGLEKGKNRFGSCDTMRRYIYIHGSPDEANIGEPRSKGCINMFNRDVIDLFDKVPVGTRVHIHE